MKHNSQIIEEGGSMKRIITPFIALVLLSGISLSQITTGGSGNWNSTTNNAPWPGGVVPTSVDNVIIASGHTVTIDVTNAQCNDLTISGTMQFKTTVSPTSVTTTGDVTNTQTTISNIASTANIKVGDFITGTGIPASTFVTAVGVNSATLSVAATATNAGVTLTVYQNIGYEITVNGDIAVNASGTLKVSNNTNGVLSPNGGIVNTLNLYGDLINNGGVAYFRSGSSGTTASMCNVNLLGSSNSTLTVPYISSSNGQFNSITINKTSPAKVILGSNIVTSGGSSTTPGNVIITFINGIVETGNYYLAYQGSSSNQVAGASSSSYVNGSFARGMSNSAGSSKDFPVGDAAAYRPVFLRSTTSGSATGHLAIVKCISGSANSSSMFSGGIDAVSSTRYFQVSYSNTIGGASSMTFDITKISYDVDDGILTGNTDIRVAYSTNNRSTWTGIPQILPYTSLASGQISSSGTSPTGDITNTSTSVTNVTSTSNVLVGAVISGTGIPAGTTVAAVDVNSLTLSAPATSSSVGSTLTIGTTSVTLSSGSGYFVSLANATGGGNPMPVELTSFNASPKLNRVELQWSTATELNNAGFEVEKNLNSKWSKIGYVEGNGTSNNSHSYSFVDATAKGKVSYRLKQIDRDGSFKFSQSVEATVVLTADDFKLSQNYPNPFNPTTQISFAVKNAEQVNVAVYNALGQTVATLFNGVAAPNEMYTLNFDGTNLSSGVYFYSLRSASRNEVKKMSLLK